MTKTTVGTKKPGPKYKVGDFLSADDKLALEVVAVITDGVMPIYGLRGPRKFSHIKWDTEFEVDDEGFHLHKMDWEAYRALQPGDVLKMGHSDSRDYMRVLARIGDVVLLSATPDKEKVEMVSTLSKQIEQLTDGQINPLGSMDADDRDMLRKMASNTHAAKVADKWMHVDMLARWNWPIIGE